MAKRKREKRKPVEPITASEPDVVLTPDRSQWVKRTREATQALARFRALPPDPGNCGACHRPLREGDYVLMGVGCHGLCEACISRDPPTYDKSFLCHINNGWHVRQPYRMRGAGS